MPIDPAIALQIRPPQVENPLQSIGALMQMRNSYSEIAVRQAQAEQERQKALQEQAVTEQKNRDLKDNSTIQEAFQNPDSAGKLGRGDASFLQGQLQPERYFKLQTDLRNQITANAALGDTVLKRNQEHGEVVAKALDGLMSLPSDEARVEAYPGVLADLRAKGVTDVIKNIPDNITGKVEDLQKFAGYNNLFRNVTEAAMARKGEQAKLEDTQAEAASRNATAQHEQLLNDALKNAANYNPSAGGVHPVDQVLPASLDPQLNASYKAAFDAAMRQPPDQNGRRPAVDTVLEQAAAHASALSPTLMQNKAKTAAAEQTAKIPAEIATQRALLPMKQAESLGLATANRAQVGADKLDAEYNTAKAAADSVGKFLDLAEAGNKAAGANVPLVGVGALNAINGIKRINSAEIHQYGTAGSLLDKIQGKLQGWTEGQPIPKDVIDDMRTLHEQLGQQAYQKYTGGLDALSKRTGVKLPPTVDAPAERVQPINLKDGRVLVPHDKAAADKFRKDHPELIK